MNKQKSFDLLSPEVQRIASELGLREETPIQTEAIPAILAGENVLIISPTGSGKTEAAMLPVFHMINADNTTEGIKAIYVTPLRALNRDMLLRLELWAARLNLRVEVRHGDTPQKTRRHQSLFPPDIMITTPETLQVLLVGSRLRSHLTDLRFLLVDEIHQLATDRRGAQLSMALERLAMIVKGMSFQRIGLSATVANKEQVAQFLCGNGRTCSIVDASAIPKDTRYNVEFVEPTPEEELKARDLYVTPQTLARMDRIIDLVTSHEKTLIFVNSRTNAETLASRFALLGMKAGVHHGSLPREERELVEQEFKSGQLHALVCTSTLELGIDIGEVDLAVQYLSPRQVNTLIQRVGRAGHALTRSSEGVIMSASPEDALESVAVAMEAIAKKLEPVTLHECPLDVLAHQLAGLLLEHSELEVEATLGLLNRSFAFSKLDRSKLLTVLEYMSKLGYLGLSGNRIFRKRKCREYYLENLSMIPDERRYNVLDLSSGKKIGILGEEFMALHAKKGLHFIIKGRVWQIEEIQTDNVFVTPVEDPSAAVPGWDGELMQLPQTVAEKVAEARRWMEVSRNGSDESALLDLTKIWPADRASRAIVIKEMLEQVSNYSVPTDKRIVLEKFDRYLIIHTSSGDRVNLTLGELFEERLLRAGLIRHWWNDGYRILIELTTTEFSTKEIAKQLFTFDSSTEGFLKAVIRKHFPFGYYMKFVAERFGALKRGMMLSGETLKELTVKFRFTPIYEETLREAELTKIDLSQSLRLLQDCAEGKKEVVCSDSQDSPSPLARYILNRYADPEYGENQDQLNTVESIKEAIQREVVSLLCFDCATLQDFVRVKDLDEKPRCSNCDSALLAPIFYGAKYAQQVLKKKELGHKISEEEGDFLSKARRSADVVLAYGKKGVVAQCVYGIGPQTASKVLSRMHGTEEEFYSDLIQAKLKFIQTKQFWD